MKLLLETDDGLQFEIKSMQAVDKKCDMVAVFLDTDIHPKYLEPLKSNVERAIGKPAIIFGYGMKGIKLLKEGYELRPEKTE